MNGVVLGLGAALAVALPLAVAAPCAAQQMHQVRSGQTLSLIAQHYNVSLASIEAANGLAEDDILRPGQVLTVPRRGVIFVRKGDTLGEIAKDHDVSLEALSRANHIHDTDVLQEGQRLLLPGYEAAEAAKKAARRWGAPRHPGTLSLIRVSTREHLVMRTLDNRGRLRSAARDRISRLLRDRVTDERHKMNPLLLRLLTRISDHFGGRTIYVVSGYRDANAHPFTSEESRHTEGRAVDFHVAGVPNQVLRDYCRKLGNVGVGSYPRSTFVHLDVRRKPAHWVDWSRPGQKPIYRRPGSSPPEDGLGLAAPKVEKVRSGPDNHAGQDDDATSSATPTPAPNAPSGA